MALGGYELFGQNWHSLGHSETVICLELFCGLKYMYFLVINDIFSKTDYSIQMDDSFWSTKTRKWIVSRSVALCGPELLMWFTFAYVLFTLDHILHRWFIKCQFGLVITTDPNWHSINHLEDSLSPNWFPDPTMELNYAFWCNTVFLKILIWNNLTLIGLFWDICWSELNY